MKKTVMAGLILVAGAAVADAQVSFRYRRQGSNYTLDIWGGFGYGTGCGTGYAHGYGYGYAGYAPGYVWRGWNSSYYGSGGYAYYPYARRARYDYEQDVQSAADFAAMRYTATRRAQAHGAPEQVQRLTVARYIEAGVRKWRTGDTAGALALFKEAVGADTSNGLAQVYMGLALVATGDFKNAEKAMAGGLPSADLGAIDLKGMFRDAKEQSRFRAALEKAGPLAKKAGEQLGMKE
jgi:hypothetical protein